MSYESDERYWTDYLRVALPVVGLLLMLGLLFWWANSIIGDEQGTQPTNTVPSGSQVAVASTNTPAETAESELTPSEVTDTASTEEAGGDGDDPTETAGDDETPTEETPDPDCDGPFRRGDFVQITEGGDGARFRDEASLAEGSFPQLPAGTQLEVVSNCYETADDFNWWEVRILEDGDNVEEGNRGFVAADFLEAVPEE